eukprot:5920734-Prymnesium_polylepis.1
MLIYFITISIEILPSVRDVTTQTYAARPRDSLACAPTATRAETGGGARTRRACVHGLRATRSMQPIAFSSTVRCR